MDLDEDYFGYFGPLPSERVNIPSPQGPQNKKGVMFALILTLAIFFKCSLKICVSYNFTVSLCHLSLHSI